ncbi:hypothetical protein NEH60_22190, partial [Xanthomonas hortorum pv. pelargonii]|uniref:hypothetical protein n=1 Tax=Xanthomonas hortorum TaxID=56454 RepID=UPI00204313A8
GRTDAKPEHAPDADDLIADEAVLSDDAANRHSRLGHESLAMRGVQLLINHAWWSHQESSDIPAFFF